MTGIRDCGPSIYRSMVRQAETIEQTLDGYDQSCLRQLRSQYGRHRAICPADQSENTTISRISTCVLLAVPQTCALAVRTAENGSENADATETGGFEIVDPTLLLRELRQHRPWKV